MSAVPAHAPRPQRPVAPARPAPAPARAPGGRARPAPARTPAAPASRPRLEVVRAPAHTRTRVPFVSLCMAILGLALLASLLLNTSMAQTSYQQHSLTIEQANLNRSIQEAQAALDTAASPRQLARAARRLGMVQSPDIAFLRLSDARVLGNPKPAAEPTTPDATGEGGR